jgi:two-component system chemotaxis response regulator CheY
VPDPEDKNILFLVVDDQFNVRRMVINFLRAFGYARSAEAADGHKALERLQAGDVGFVISDWNMPTMTGLDLLKRVRADQRFKTLPFLMVTAEVLEQVVAEAIEESVDGYIVKPFQAKTLIDKIEEVLDKRRAPDPLDLALRRGYEHLGEGRPAEALDQFMLAQELNDQSPRVHLALGEALEALDEPERAIASYQAALAASDRFVKAHDRLAALYARVGQGDKAVVHLAKAAKVSPRNPRRQLDMGRMLMEQGRTEEAAKALNFARETAQDDPSLASEVGELFLSAGLNLDAAKAFKSAVTIDPNQVHIYNRLGIAYRRQKLFAEAVAEYQRALEVAPEDENLYFNMAVAYAEGGQRDQAAKALQMALGLRPDFGEARALLERLAQ